MWIKKTVLKAQYQIWFHATEQAAESLASGELQLPTVPGGETAEGGYQAFGYPPPAQPFGYPPPQQPFGYPPGPPPPPAVEPTGDLSNQYPGMVSSGLILLELIYKLYFIVCSAFC